jgi:Pyridine nucleotide-disulphide oxidoreductase
MRSVARRRGGGLAAIVVWRSGDWMNRQPERLPNERPTVLIAGSGFGGFHAARELERRLPAEAADIVLASPDDHLTYGPLLPNVAAGVLEPRHVAVALHGELRRTRYLTGALTALDIPGRTATLSDSDGKGLECALGPTGSGARCGNPPARDTRPG